MYFIHLRNNAFFHITNVFVVVWLCWGVFSHAMHLLMPQCTGGKDAIKAIEPSLQAPGGVPLLVLSAWLTVHVGDQPTALQDMQAPLAGTQMSSACCAML